MLRSVRTLLLKIWPVDGLRRLSPQMILLQNKEICHRASETLQNHLE